MKISEEKIEIVINGKPIKPIRLHRGSPRVVLYFENDDIAAEKAQGKPKPQAKAEAKQREATAFFNAAINSIRELSRLDAAAADALIAEVYSGFAVANEARPGGGTNRKTLEQRAAAMFFAWRDAEDLLEEKAGLEDTQLFTNICFNVDDEYQHGRIKAGSRTREAMRSFKETKDKAEKEARRELSPEGQAIFDALEAAKKELEAERHFNSEDEEEEWFMNRYETAEAPLDALALKDPEEATRIFNRSSFFDYESGDGDIYLGQGVFCRRDELMKLDTPEKRAAYVNSIDSLCGDEDGADDLPGEDEPGAGDLPLTICGGEAVKIDSGEPVTLEGFTDPAIIG